MINKIYNITNIINIENINVIFNVIFVIIKFASPLIFLTIIYKFYKFLSKYKRDKIIKFALDNINKTTHNTSDNPNSVDIDKNSILMRLISPQEGLHITCSKVNNNSKDPLSVYVYTDRVILENTKKLIETDDEMFKKTKKIYQEAKKNNMNINNRGYVPDGFVIKPNVLIQEKLNKNIINFLNKDLKNDVLLKYDFHQILKLNNIYEDDLNLFVKTQTELYENYIKCFYKYVSCIDYINNININDKLQMTFEIKNKTFHLLFRHNSNMLVQINGKRYIDHRFCYQEIEKFLLSGRTNRNRNIFFLAVCDGNNLLSYIDEIKKINISNTNSYALTTEEVKSFLDQFNV